MVDLLEVVVVAGLVFTLAAMYAQRVRWLPGWVHVSGPIATLHTERGKAFLDWLATPRRFWRAWGNFGVGVALVVMTGSFLLVLFAGFQAVVDPTPTAVNRPRNVLAIPGVNQFLPLSVAGEIVAGLLLGLVVHEGGHGLLCRVEDIDINSMGLALLTFVPLGAFVEPDEDSRDAADRGAQTRMFAAGVTNNFAVAIVAFALLFGPVTGAIAVVDGVPVGGTIEGSPADQGGLAGGDVVTAVEGQPVANYSELETALSDSDAATVTVERADAPPVTVERRVLVTAAVQGAPLSVDTTVTAVNGTAVHTVSGFRSAVADRPVARLTTGGGEAVTAPIGAYVVVQEGDPFDAAGAPGGEAAILTSIAGERVVDAGDVGDALEPTAPGDVVPVVAYVDGQRQRYDVRLGSQGDGSGYLGVVPQPGVSGFQVEDFGIDPYPAAAFLSVLGGDGPGDSVLVNAFLVISLPFAGAAIPGTSYNFAGFVAPFTGFFTVQGPLAFLGGGVFLLANLLFWTAWINLIIGQFNLIPTYPLDGGHILRSSAEAVVARLPVARGHGLARALTITVSVAMIAGMGLMIFGPRLLT